MKHVKAVFTAAEDTRLLAFPQDNLVAFYVDFQSIPLTNVQVAAQFDRKDDAT